MDTETTVEAEMEIYEYMHECYMESLEDAQNEAIDRCRGLLDTVSGGFTAGRYDALCSAIRGIQDIEEVARATVEECADEKTGLRYGQAACRRGRCAKLGSGGRNKGQRGYQVWLVWA